MRLIVHAGLHKTASTYFQHAMRLNRAALRARGIYAAPDNGYEANHATAWVAAAHDFIGVTAHVRQATIEKCREVILSSEDFESLILAPEGGRPLEAAARAAGATSIEWHFVLRDPGQYFASMYTELGKHGYVEFSTMFVAAFSGGRFRDQRDVDSQPGHFDYCFDHERHLKRFAERTGGDLVFHDFRDAKPFPGHGILGALGALDAITHLPPDTSRNQRAPIEITVQRMGARLAAVTEAAGLTAEISELLNDHVVVTAAVEDACAAAISQKYAPGMERLLKLRRLSGAGTA